MSTGESGGASAWRRSWRVVAVAVLFVCVVPLTVTLRAHWKRERENNAREFEQALERRRLGDAMLQRYVDREASPEERMRVLRLIAENAHSDSIQVWATAELPIVEAEVLKAKRQRETADRLQMEAFHLTAKALSKEPVALAEHYRQLGVALAEGRLGQSGTIQSLASEVAVPPRLSDLMHKLIDEKQACLQSGKDEVACGDALGVVAEPTLDDFEAMRALEDKREDPDAQRRLVDMRKRFLKEN